MRTSSGMPLAPLAVGVSLQGYYFPMESISHFGTISIDLDRSISLLLVEGSNNSLGNWSASLRIPPAMIIGHQYQHCFLQVLQLDPAGYIWCSSGDVVYLQ